MAKQVHYPSEEEMGIPVGMHSINVGPDEETTIEEGGTDGDTASLLH